MIQSEIFILYIPILALLFLDFLEAIAAASIFSLFFRFFLLDCALSTFGAKINNAVKKVISCFFF